VRQVEHVPRATASMPVMEIGLPNVTKARGPVADGVADHLGQFAAERPLRAFQP
jgi:hypothetical protein